jgi:hypothetical protein
MSEPAGMCSGRRVEWRMASCPDRSVEAEKVLVWATVVWPSHSLT